MIDGGKTKLRPWGMVYNVCWSVGLILHNRSRICWIDRCWSRVYTGCWSAAYKSSPTVGVSLSSLTDADLQWMRRENKKANLQSHVQQFSSNWFLLLSRPVEEIGTDSMSSHHLRWPL
jgi:hypothetical protein